jgi:hypothetical protein
LKKVQPSAAAAVPAHAGRPPSRPGHINFLLNAHRTRFSGGSQVGQSIPPVLSAEFFSGDKKYRTNEKCRANK